MKTKEAMIADILQALKANDCYITGDLFFTIAFRTEAELRAICRELHIPVT